MRDRQQNYGAFLGHVGTCSRVANDFYGTASIRTLMGAPVTEAIMPVQSSMHFYLNWAKERIYEMDATLASLETRANQVQAKAGQVQADSRVRADQLVADLKKRQKAAR
jgi:hypothetical protein